MAKEPIIKVDKLSVIYFLGRPNQVNALVDANLEIYPGEFVIFFGPSGCGKSTLLYSIAGLERNTQGDIYIGGKNLAKFNNLELDHHRQKVIGMIFQAYYLINSLSVLGNTILPQFSLGGKKKEREARAMELLKFFSVKEQANKFPNELSGGQQQRVAICRSLMNDPQIILADEPTGNLDSKSATDVMNLLSNLNEEKGKTIILVTHSPGSLEYAHRVFYMKDGRIIDVKVNRDIKTKINKTSLATNPLAKDLEPMGKAHSDLASEISEKGNLLVNLKSQAIVAEILTGLSLEEIGKIEQVVQKMIVGSLKAGAHDLNQYLDRDVYAGGLGLNSKAAQSLTEKIKLLVKEIKNLQGAEKEAKDRLNFNDNPQITGIRHYIFDQFDIRLGAPKTMEVFDGLVARRLKNKTDEKEMRKVLDLPVAKGGVGLDKRLAARVAKRIELLIAGKI